MMLQMIYLTSKYIKIDEISHRISDVLCYFLVAALSTPNEKGVIGVGGRLQGLCDVPRCWGGARRRG